MKKLCISLICVLLSLITALGCVGCTQNGSESDRTSDTSQNTPDISDSSDKDKDTEKDSTSSGGSTNGGTSEDLPSTQQKPAVPSVPGGAVAQYYFSESGRLISDTGTHLNLYINWTATSNDGENLKVKFTVGIESYSIQVGARENLGKFKLNGKAVNFSSDALTIADNRKKVNTDFETFEYNYTFTKGDEITLDVLASWIFNGVYGGTQVGTIVSGGTITLKMPE